MALQPLTALYDEAKAQRFLALFPLLTNLSYPVFPSLTMNYGGMALSFSGAHLDEDSLEELIRIVRDAGLKLNYGFGTFNIQTPEDHDRSREFERNRRE